MFNFYRQYHSMVRGWYFPGCSCFDSDHHLPLLLLLSSIFVSLFVLVFERTRKTCSSCLCCLPKRRRRRSTCDEIPVNAPPIYSYIISNSAENIPNVNNDIIDDSRPASNVSGQNMDNIQLVVIPTPRKKIKPHYALPQHRTARVAPSPSSAGALSNRSTSITPEKYLFGSQYAAKVDRSRRQR
jgi:hypothetical protein